MPSRRLTRPRRPWWATEKVKVCLVMIKVCLVMVKVFLVMVKVCLEERMGRYVAGRPGGRHAQGERGRFLRMQ